MTYRFALQFVVSAIAEMMQWALLFRSTLVRRWSDWRAGARYHFPSTRGTSRRSAPSSEHRGPMGNVTDEMLTTCTVREVRRHLTSAQSAGSVEGRTHALSRAVAALLDATDMVSNPDIHLYIRGDSGPSIADL